MMQPGAAPAGLAALAGSWYTLLGDTIVFFALVDGSASAPRVVYRWAEASTTP